MKKENQVRVYMALYVLRVLVLLSAIPLVFLISKPLIVIFVILCIYYFLKIVSYLFERKCNIWNNINKVDVDDDKVDCCTRYTTQFRYLYNQDYETMVKIYNGELYSDYEWTYLEINKDGIGMATLRKYIK